MVQVKVAHASRPASRCTPLLGKSILIVEDEPLIALDLHAALSAAGAGIIAATDIPEALRLILRNEVSAAVLDVNLGGRDCDAVCQALLHNGIPFLFYTGHPDAQILKAWPEVPVLKKPMVREPLVALVTSIAR
jgi:DNA-binding response OmpR family regulator